MAGRPMRHAVVIAALKVPDISPQERCVLAYFTDRGDKYGLAWPSRELVSAELSMHPKTLQRALRALERRGYITREGRARPGRTLEIRLHPERWPRPHDPRRGGR